MDLGEVNALPGAAVEKWAARHGPRGALFRAGAICADLPLTVSEAQGLGRVSCRRRQQFATGRTLARDLLGRLRGGSDLSLPIRRDGAPGWPLGFVGSIAHSDALCLVGVARSPAILAIGVDLEPVAPLDDQLAALICRPDETVFPSGWDALAHFVAKEAFYKAYSTLADGFLDFCDVRVRFDQSGDFHASIVNPARPSPAVLQGVGGKISIKEGHYVAIVCV